jgi:hypothetical protein
MSTIKKVLLFLFGIFLLIFGNRDVLAKISKAGNAPAGENEKPAVPVAAPVDTAKEAVTAVAPSAGETKAVTAVADDKAVATPKKKAHKVVRSEEKEKSLQDGSKTKIEKDKPEKASSTE